MKKNYLWILLLCIIHSILFFGQSLGMNVFIYIILIMLFIYCFLKQNDFIRNKVGLLFFIPILILSGTYGVYHNIFNVFNMITIPVLYCLLFIYAMKPTGRVDEVIDYVVKLILMPIDYLEDVIKELKSYLPSIIRIKDEDKKKMKSFLIVIPITIVILILLSSADIVFGNYFKGIIPAIKSIKISNITYRFITIGLLFLYISAFFYYILNRFLKVESYSKNMEIDNFTMKLLLSILNGIYIVFDIIQINSLMLHRVSKSINYAEYARSGFFQLMVISIINLVIILLSKKSKDSLYIKGMSIGMVFLTLIIIVSSFLRMNLYEQAYGYTLLRLGVYVILITEGILLIPTIIYILKSKFNVLNYYMIITIAIYLFVNLFSVDCIIAKKNINRYYRVGDIDIEYLENGNYDNTELLLEFYQKCKDEKIKSSLEKYFKRQKKNINMDNIFEFNISKNKAKNLLK